LLAERLYDEGPAFAEAWNFGPYDADARPVQSIVEHLVAKWGDGATWQRDEKTHPHEATYLKLDSSKARNRLGWTSLWTIEFTLEQIVKWQRAWLDGRDMHKVTLAQISDYEHVGRSNF